MALIVKLQALETDEFYADDSDDRRGESGRTSGRIVQSINCVLSKIDPSEDMQREIYHFCCVGFSLGHLQDKTFKPICDALRGLGYEIVDDKKEQKAILSSRKKTRVEAKKAMPKEEKEDLFRAGGWHDEE
jgi:hypothetical protein